MIYFRTLITLCLLRLHSCSDPEVDTSFGKIRGTKRKVHVKFADEFLGIPYAKPPIGDLRFAKPKEWTEKWNEPLIAQKPKPACYQKSKIQMSEDCLYLSVWTPSNRSANKLLPVMFWIHGGGFTGGSGSHAYGGILSAFSDTVVVAINYRLNAFGFLFGNSDEVPGNVGLYDQTLALKWVKNNIIKFGGDPNLVTIFGVSAGGWSVTLHLLSPISRTYFHGAIAMSGVEMDYLGVDKKEYAFKRSSAFAKTVNCSVYPKATSLSKETINCLRSKDAESIVNALNKVAGAAPKTALHFPFLPIFGESFIPKEPRKMWKEKEFKTNCSLLIGTVFNEFVMHHFMKMGGKPSDWMRLFLKKFPHQFLTQSQIEALIKIYFTGVDEIKERSEAMQIATQLYDDIVMHCPSEVFGEVFASGVGNSVHQYVFNYKSKSDNPGCDPKYPCHGSEMPFTFGGIKSLYDINASLFWMKILADFAKTGDTFWPAYYRTAEKQLVAPYYEFKGNVNLRNIQFGFRHFKCQLWKSMVFK